ncbi:hypothetical protein C8F04DRAFT_1211182 [Mycena alexandri]|uniref:C2H2-type domain-containing protein n=1 Tax=Mycena alexandri TaxID=1745969 RepID=A0AAD6SUY6_9AGAR|nr:hypothetical protein C8F04DRAFT_1211182 [Mycena alexandri]
MTVFLTSKACTDHLPVERRSWILVKSGAKHLTTPPHLQAVRLTKEREKDEERRREILEKERDAAALVDRLREIQSSAQMTEAEREMWQDYELNGATSPEMREQQLRKEAEIFGLWNPEATANKLGFGCENTDGEENEDEDWLAEIIRNAGLDSEGKLFLLDILDNLPRLRVSSSLMRVFLWFLKAIGCKDVPSFDHLRRVQKELRAQCGIPSIPCKSPMGNVFYMNDPRAIIAKDWANPTTHGVIREIWHADKWRKNMDLDILSPMYDAGLRHYYVNEVARLGDGRVVIPIRWVKFRGRVYADAFGVSFDDQNLATINDETTIFICAEDLTDNYYDLEQSGTIPKWGASTMDAGRPSRMPNPKREIAKGRPLYSSFVSYFADDVSGNKSKSWNKHWNAYMTHQNLPRKLLQQEFHVHFVSTSPNATVSEQFLEFKAARALVHALSTCFCIHCNAGFSDNPMQSEVASHIGGKGNCFCRKCRVGGNQKEKATDEGYHALFEAGVPRTKEYIILELEKQVKLACSGVVKPVKDLQTATGVKDTYTQFWIDGLISRFKEMRKDEPNRSADEIRDELVQWTVDNRDSIYSGFLTMKGFDPAKDTPIELLHTILLGIIKYIWHITHTPWSAEQKKTYALRLQSTNIDGLSVHPIRSTYILQYAGSLIGRQLKTLAQTSVFHVHGLVTDDYFTAWKAAGELSALLWVSEIRNPAQYRQDLKIAVANVLDIFATIDPSKIITKIKYHLLVHAADEDVVQFGPLIGVATELFESFNGVFRLCSVLSNHLAPSGDIAVQLGDQEGLKHRLTGGRWPIGEDGRWERAGSGVRQFMAEHPVLQRLMGWTEPSSMKHGTTNPLSSFPRLNAKRGEGPRPTFQLKSTTAAKAVNYGLFDANSTWNKCSFVISESLDECSLGSWVFATSPTAADSIISGRISDILVDAGDKVLVVLELFQVLSARDEIFGMPVLVRRDSEGIKFKFNVQHDCTSAKCEASGQRLRMQERVESDQIDHFIIHEPLDRFFINMHAFHNAHFLRATLPRSLVAPIPLFPDRQNISMASRKASLARKRKRPEDNGDEEEVEPRPRKTQKKAPEKQSKKTAGPILPPAHFMVATRTRRTIQLTEKARAAQEAAKAAQEAEESENEEDDSELETDEGYLDSDGDYSD